MSLCIINLATLDTVSVRSEPFLWCNYNDLIFPDKQTELAKHYPVQGFKQSSRYEGDKKHYRFNVLPLLDHNNVTDNFHFLAPVWQAFINELCSETYLHKILKLYGIELDDYHIDVGCFRFKQGDWVEPHVDHPDKVLTQLFYFNARWDEKWGGMLLLHANKTINEVFAYFPPNLSSSVALKRTDNAWHSVTPLTANCESDRLTVQLEVWRKHGTCNSSCN